MADANWLALDFGLTLKYKSSTKMLTASLLPDLICDTIRKTRRSQTLSKGQPQRFMLRLAVTDTAAVMCRE